MSQGILKKCYYCSSKLYIGMCLNCKKLFKEKENQKTLVNKFGDEKSLIKNCVECEKKYSMLSFGSTINKCKYCHKLKEREE